MESVRLLRIMRGLSIEKGSVPWDKPLFPVEVMG